MDMFDANVYWFHIFQSMIESGDVAKMGPHATTVYLVIKASSNYKHGAAFPSIDTIVKRAGVSKRMVYKCLDTLVDHGYLSIEKSRGNDKRRNIYRLREKVHLDKNDAKAVASWDYIPSQTSEAVAELKNFIAQGVSGEGKHVHIENLNIQTVNAEAGSQVVAINSAPTSSSEKLSQMSHDELMEEMRKVIAAKGKSED